MKKETLGIIAIIVTFLGSEILLDKYLEVTSITTKIIFVVVVILIYYLIAKILLKKTKV